MTTVIHGEKRFPTMILTNPKFPLGEVMMTAHAAGQLNPLAVAEALSRHAFGDWGEVCDADARENELSLREGYRLLSVYGTGEDRFWIITEADRSVTTVLMPDDY